MKIELRTINEEKGIIQITTPDERFYAIPQQDLTYKYIPSVTWICESYPKGIGFYKWLANKGWEESVALKEAAGDKGSKVHHAISELINGNTVKMEDEFQNSDGIKQELTVEEYECLMSFKKWADDIKPQFIDTNITVFNEQQNYAGTIDVLCLIEGRLWVVDFKTSANIWPSHKLQVSAYKHALNTTNDLGLAILQLGYARNKNNYKFTEVEDCFDLFLSTYNIWYAENKNIQPKQKDYPIEIKL